jgi:glycosyltransferase involved in cell wall biosynthesis
LSAQVQHRTGWRQRVAAIARRVGIKRGRGLGWSTVQSNPPDAEPVESWGLFALVNTWNEEDIIAATVKNAFAQGCERVFLLDNASADGTVAEAEGAGAELALSFESDHHDVARSVGLARDIAARETASSGYDHVWWLCLDADEFPHGPNGTTVREHVAQLDRRFRVVGSEFWNHYPTTRPESVRGFHPIDFQPMCDRTIDDKCVLRHFKHQLVRFDEGSTPLTLTSGYHRVKRSPDVAPLIEADAPILVHHFRYRTEAATRRRLEQLVERHANKDLGVRNVRTANIEARRSMLDDVYAQRWDHINDPNPWDRHRHPRPRPWVEQVPAEHQHIARWYTADELAAAVASETARR